MKNGFRKIVSIICLFCILISPLTLSIQAATTTITNNKYYAFQNVHSGMFLDVANGFAVSGNNIWQCTFNASEAQQFLILGPESGINSTSYHQIAPKGNTSLRLDVANAWDSNGASIGLFVSNPGYGAQSFRFISNGDGSFRIMPYLSSTRVIGIEGNSNASLANVALYTWTGHDSQRWILKEVDQYFSMNWTYPFHGTDATTYRNITTRFSSSHVGIDVPAPDGTALYSPAAGTVWICGWENSMGNYVITQTNSIDSSTGKRLTYRIMHLNGDPLVSNGQSVTVNTKLGYVGNTGDSQGAHLHIDVNNKEYRNGSEIRGDFDSAIRTEQLFSSVRFTYSSGNTYA